MAKVTVELPDHIAEGEEVHFPNGKVLDDGNIVGIALNPPAGPIIIDANGQAEMPCNVTIQPSGEGSAPVTVDASQVFTTADECATYVEEHPEIFGANPAAAPTAQA